MKIKKAVSDILRIMKTLNKGSLSSLFFLLGMKKITIKENVTITIKGSLFLNTVYLDENTKVLMYDVENNGEVGMTAGKIYFC